MPKPRGCIKFCSVLIALKPIKWYAHYVKEFRFPPKAFKSAKKTVEKIIHQEEKTRAAVKMLTFWRCNFFDCILILCKTLCQKRKKWQIVSP
jgi:hypothetical protein